jgi:hypothetical protein
MALAHVNHTTLTRANLIQHRHSMIFELSHQSGNLRIGTRAKNQGKRRESADSSDRNQVSRARRGILGKHGLTRQKEEGDYKE